MTTHQRQLFWKLPLLLLGMLPFAAFSDTGFELPKEGSLREQWLSMNFYQVEGEGFKSEIVNPEFFLSPTGNSSPGAEYNAFSKAMHDYQVNAKNKDVLCRFPARTTLLLRHVENFKNFRRPSCSDYPRYMNPEKVRGVSLVFASGYFESPASYFGHLMMKFDTDQKDTNEFFFDSSLNYGAQVTDTAGSPMYIIHGMTGGYKASFQRNNDFINTYNYTNKDMRDIWEYPLDLTDEQRTFIVEYSSELRNARFTYYFLTDNCAHRIARLLEVTTGHKLVKTDGPWLLPIEVVQALKNTSTGASPLKSEKRIPSLKSQLRMDYLALNNKDRSRADTYFKSNLAEQGEQVLLLSDSALKVARNYYDVQLAKLSTQPKDVAKAEKIQAHRQIILVERFKRTAEVNPSYKETTESKESLTPSTMQPPASLHLGYLTRPKSDSVNLRFQAANNDLLTQPFEGQETSRFIAGAFEVEASKANLKLKSVTLADIISLNTNPLPMSATGEYSWSLKAEYGPRNLICIKCSTINLDGKVGKALRVNENLMMYSLIGGQVNHRETQYNDTFMATSENGILVSVDKNLRLNIEANAEISPIHGNPAYLFKGILAWDVATRSDIRLAIENDGKQSAAMLRYGWYLK